MTSLRFAAIGLDHSHIFGQVEFMLRAGAELAAFHASEDRLAKPFAERYPQAKRVDDPRRILEDDSIALVVSASIPCERAALGISAMRHGKDFMVDKPGMVSLAELDEVARVQSATGGSIRSAIPSISRHAARCARANSSLRARSGK
jgi:predicted dehydrogenase